MALFSRKSRPKPPVQVPPPGPSKPGQPSRSPSGPPAAVEALAAGPKPDENRIFELGAQMLERARGHKAGVLSAKFYSDALMDWSMKDQNFKVQMFRFVDAFPMLRSAEAIHDHLEDYLSQPGVTVPGPIAAALKAGKVMKSASAGVISKQITSMAQRFIAGTDAASALPNLRRLWKEGIAFSVDLLGEACLSDVEADAYQAKYLDLIENLPKEVAAWEPNERLESDHLGPIPRVNVSIKVSSLSARCDPIDTEGSIRDMMKRIGPILTAAGERGVFINFDMEHHDLKDLTLELFKRCCEQYKFRAGLAMQAYLRSGVEDARNIAEWAKKTGRIVSVRLVKGAYWDSEVIHAEERGWPCPVWTEKWQSDACFERMTEVFLDACPRSAEEGGVKLALGSHNVRSIAAALAAAERRGLPHKAVEIQMLHGMADQLKHAASEMGLRVREYVPVGEMIPGMAYLVRRLLENTSNESWLKAGFLDNADPRELLKQPGGARPETGASSNGAIKHAAADLSSPERHKLSPAVEGVGDGRPFFSEPMRDFSRADVRAAFAAAVERAVVPQVANDRTPEQAAEMVAKAAAAFPRWRDESPRARAAVLTRAADLMRKKRDELSGVIIKENGKTWREADADVCEAIDFCEYYARLAVPLFERQRLGRFIGELDEVWHQPRGVAAVIAPWNFPIAICCGMTVAALVTGNTVVMKPAEQTPGIAKLLAEILWEAGAPKDVLHFCPAPGETTGAALVRDPRIALIAFTGSKAVGLDIIEAASRNPTQHAEGATARGGTPPRSSANTQYPQEHVKRVICEMGGKNAIIVDTSADLDEAVLGVRASAFGFQGQKCSACSRVIVVDPEGPDGPAITHFTARLVEATRALVMGDPTKPGTDVGPVIDAEAAEKIRFFIAKAKEEGGRLVLGGMTNDELRMTNEEGNDDELRMTNDESAERASGGEAVSPIRNSSFDIRHSTFIPPHIFTHVTPDHTIAREEIFGPVLAVMHARDFDEALAIANGVPYKLTGGVFTRKPAHIERAKRDFRIGNLYINRSITGALVGRQPFGGFGMSGVGSKAGGAEYLLQFVEPRASCENTMRRGFAPEL